MVAAQQQARSGKKRDNSFVVEVGKDPSHRRYLVARKDLGRVRLDKLKIPAGAHIMFHLAAASPDREVPKAEAFQPGARAKALLQGTKLVEEDLRASGGAFSLADVRRLMHGVSRQAINKRVNEGSLLAVPGPSNRSLYPVVQFGNDGMPVEGLKEVRRALATKSPWMLLNFLVTKEPRLGGRKPVDLLKAGDVSAVVEAARRAGVQGG